MKIVSVFKVLMIAASVFAFSACSRADQKPESPQGYPDPVIPFMETLPFPWDTIEGIWQARVDGKPIWFSFEIRSSANGTKFLHVLQLEPSTNSVVAEGRGFIDERTNVVKAGMIPKDGLKTYMLFLGLYKNEKLSRLPPVVTMLTTRKFNGQEDELSVMVDKIAGYREHRAP